MKAKLKTKETEASVQLFLKSIEDPDRRADCFTMLALVEKVMGVKAKMWGPSIVGAGDYHYAYESGREGDWFKMGFSPRKQALTLYFMSGAGSDPKLRQRLGKIKEGKGCIYVKSLQDIDMLALETLIRKNDEILTLQASKRK